MPQAGGKLVLVAAAWAVLGLPLAGPAPGGPTAEGGQLQPADGRTDRPAPAAATPEDPEFKKAKLKLGLVLTIAMVVAFFSIVLVTAVIRGWRRQRERAGLGKKSPPTEYVDVWRQHRLRDANLHQGED
jgi:hypothetical protein